MATPGEAVDNKLLHKVEGVLDAGEQEERLLYLLPRAAVWLEDNLSKMEADGFYDNAPSPIQQADDLFYSYIAGEDMATDWPPHVMRPSEHGVWELRTADLRFFGWFWRKCVFIVSAVDQAQRCKELSLYSGYRNQCVMDRKSLKLDDPEFTIGEIEDVL